MFETASAGELVGVVEDTAREESMLMARRMSAVAALLWLRTNEAGDGPTADPGYALITGFARTSAEVGAAMNMSSKAAKDVVAAAEALDSRLPEVAKLLAAGKVDWATVALIVDRTELVDWGLMDQIDPSLAEQIGGWGCWSRKRIINAVDAAVIAADPDAAKERRVNADTERHISITKLPNGTARVRATLSAPAAALVDKRLSEMAKEVCHGDSRTIEQRRVDAWVALCEGRALACDCADPDCPNQGADPNAPATTSRFVINVIATAETITGNGDHPGYLENYGVIDAEQVRDLAENAALCELAEPTVTEEQAARYQPTPSVERWVRCRGLTCSFPGCDRPAWRADIDHSVAFDRTNPAAGGPTRPANLDPKCREHHRLKTFHTGPDGWATRQHPDGTVVWTSPTGRTYRVAPAGADLFPGLRRACRAPTARRHSRIRDRWAHTEATRDRLEELRPANAETRRINAARAQEIQRRQWRNNMRRTLLVFKGGQPSTSPYCPWVNDPLEDEHITADWQPPPRPTPEPGDDQPPF
jgi:hypothetical protein